MSRVGLRVEFRVRVWVRVDVEMLQLILVVGA